MMHCQVVCPVCDARVQLSPGRRIVPTHPAPRGAPPEKIRHAQIGARMIPVATGRTGYACAGSGREERRS